MEKLWTLQIFYPWTIMDTYIPVCTYSSIYLIIYLHHLCLPIYYPSINASIFLSFCIQRPTRCKKKLCIKLATVFHLYTKYQMWTSRDQGLCFPDTKHIPSPSKWEKQVSFCTRNSRINKSWNISVNTSRDFYISFILIGPKMEVRGSWEIRYVDSSGHFLVVYDKGLIIRQRQDEKE